MKTFYGQASVEVRLVDAYYTEGALLREGRTALALSLEGANDAMRDADRAWQDQHRPVSRAIAWRDLAGDDLHDLSREVQVRLYGRSADAKTESPAVDILPHGVGEFARAKVGDRGTAYKILVRRIEDHLPATDPVRIEFVPKLRAGLQGWDDAIARIAAANVDLDAARNRRDKAIAAWAAEMASVYGALVSDLGKKKAERFFRKPSSEPKVEATPAAETPETAEAK